jgi:hypothetical protein
MLTKFNEPTEMLAACSKALQSMTASVDAKLVDTFPGKKTLQTNPELQLAIIAEQAEKLLTLKPEASLFGLEVHEDDHLALIKMFLDDLVQFTTLHHIDLGINIAAWRQMKITEHACFHLAVSPLLPSTYESIDQVGGRVFDTYSIPFKIRLALELKLRSITGFEKHEIIQKGKPTIYSKELPFEHLLNALLKINCLGLKCSLSEIKKIYKWSCNFCHTGEKEFMWLSMKALEIISPLYIYSEQQNQQVYISNIWPTEGMTDDEQCERLMEHEGPVRPLYYFRDGWTVQKLQETINKNEMKNKPNQKTYVYYFAEKNLAEINSYYCNRSRKYV